MKTYIKRVSQAVLSAILLLSAPLAKAADQAAAANTDYKLDVNTILTACAGLLLIVIFVLGSTLYSTIKFYHEKRKQASSSSNTATKLFSILFFALLFASEPTFAQDAAQAADVAVGPIPESTVVRWILFLVLAIEVLIIFLFARLIRFFTGVDAMNTAAKKSGVFDFDFAAFWNKINKFKPIEEEASLDTGHSYDGIRELNNVTPPWFLAGFALSIVFAFVYMYRYHVVKAAPLMIEEYTLAVEEAKIKQAEYLKTQANNVDETNVVLLGADGIAAGQALYASNCVACHGDKGQGASVGPNLSDNYWIHKGSIKDIFKSIKYGWQEKGMKSWKDDFSPNQIAQIASYVYSLKGSNPAGAKEPQGELYTEEAAPAAADSTVITAAADTTKK